VSHSRRVEQVEIDMSSASNSSCRASRAVLFDNVDTAKMHGLGMSNVSSCVESSQVEFGLHTLITVVTSTQHCIMFNITLHLNC